MEKTPLLPKFEDPVRLCIVTSGDVKAATLHCKGLFDGMGIGYQTLSLPGLAALPAAVSITHRTGDFDGYLVLGTGQGRRAVNDALLALGGAGLCLGIALGPRKKPLGNKSGKNAALAALHLVALSRKWGRQRKGVGFKPASEQFLMAGDNQDGHTTT